MREIPTAVEDLTEGVNSLSDGRNRLSIHLPAGKLRKHEVPSRLLKVEDRRKHPNSVVQLV